MTELNQVYKCNICGNIVEILHVGQGQLVCCGELMELLEEKTIDEGKEKHVPIINREGDKVIVRVGEVLHPMEENHYIEWIEILCENACFRKLLKPGNKPEALFVINNNDFLIRIYCNIHGLWKSK